MFEGFTPQPYPLGVLMFGTDGQRRRFAVVGWAPGVDGEPWPVVVPVATAMRANTTTPTGRPPRLADPSSVTFLFGEVEVRVTDMPLVING